MLAPISKRSMTLRLTPDNARKAIVFAGRYSAAAPNLVIESVRAGLVSYWLHLLSALLSSLLS